MAAIINVLVFIYTELFLGGMEKAGLIISHTRDGQNMRLTPGVGLIPRSEIAVVMATGLTPVFFTESHLLRDNDNRPVVSGSDRTWMQVIGLQKALEFANLGRSYEKLEARIKQLSELYGFRIPLLGPKAYAAQLESQASHPGEYIYLAFPGNALGGGKGIPVAFAGRIKDFARVWGVDGKTARKWLLSFCKWGQPAFTQATGITEVEGSRPLKAAVIAEEVMEFHGWKLGTKKHDGLFIFNGAKCKFYGRRYGSEELRGYKTVMVRYRDGGPIEVGKGLSVFLDGKDFRAEMKRLGVTKQVDMVTSSGNIKQGDATEYRTFIPEKFDFINLTSQRSGGMSIGRQLLKAGINQKAAYDLFTFCRQKSFRYIPFLTSMVPEKRDPLDVFVMALRWDWEAIMNILMSVDMISFKDCVSLVKRNMIVKRSPGMRPTVCRYKTNYNSLAPKLTSFYANYVIKAHGHFPLAYIIDNERLDILRQEEWDMNRRRVNPYIPNKAKQKKIKLFYSKSLEWRLCVEKQPVVGAASIQACDLVVHDSSRESGYRMFDPKTDSVDDIVYSQYGDEVSCVYLQQCPADCDGDQIAFQMYPAREGNEFERCPVFDWTDIAGKKKGEVPETEVEFLATYFGVLSKLRSTIGVVDNIMTRFGCQQILRGETYPVKQSMRMALAFEYWVIKEQMRPGGKGESQENAIEKLVATFMGGKEPMYTSLFKFSKDDQGVGYGEGHAKVVNWILINANRVVKEELHKVHAKGGVFMYEDIAVRIAREFPKTGNDKTSAKWGQDDMDSLFMKEQFMIALRSVTDPKGDIFIGNSTMVAAAQSAANVNAIYSLKSTAIMDEWREGKLTAVEKSERFNALMGEEMVSVVDSQIPDFTRVDDNGIEYSDWLARRRFERALCIHMGIIGFEKKSGNGGFAFHASPQTVAFIAERIWPENPICKQLKSFTVAHKQYHGVTEDDSFIAVEDFVEARAMDSQARLDARLASVDISKLLKPMSDVEVAFKAGKLLK